MAQRPQLTASQRLAIATFRLKRAGLPKLNRVEWEAMYGGRSSPEEDELLLICDHMITNPHRMAEGPSDWYLHHALQKLVTIVAKPPPRRKSEKVAELVDQLMDAGIPIAEARKQVAASQKKTIEAVKQAHLRYGRKRDISR
jgi:hypothetical protein